MLAASIRILGQLASDSGELFCDYTGGLVRNITTRDGSSAPVLNFILAAHSLAHGPPLPIFEHVSNLVKGHDLLAALFAFQSIYYRILRADLRLRITMDCAPQLLNVFCQLLNKETATAYRERVWQEARSGKRVIRPDKSGNHVDARGVWCFPL